MADAQFCLLAIEHWSTCMTKAEWSGWVQAVGSVGALLGIWYTVRRQRQLALEADERNARAANAAALNNARNVVAMLSAALEQIDEATASANVTALRLHRARLADFLTIAQTVKLEHLSLRHQAATLSARQMAGTVAGCIDSLAESPSDRARIIAVQNLRLVVTDQLEKIKKHELAIAAPE